MSGKFHINPQTIGVGRCQAQRNCPYGGAEVHFDSIEKAQRRAEKRLSEVLETFTKNREPHVGESVLLEYRRGSSRRTAKIGQALRATETEILIQIEGTEKPVWVSKEALVDPTGELFVARRSASGRFIGSDELFVQIARRSIRHLEEIFENLSEEKSEKIAEVWAQEDHSKLKEILRKAKNLAQNSGRAKMLKREIGKINAIELHYLHLNETRKAFECALVGELMRDKLGLEEYLALTSILVQSGIHSNSE